MRPFELTRERPETCLSDLALERLLLGELVGVERTGVEQHLGGCLACQERRIFLSAASVEVPNELWWRQHAPRRSRRPVFAALATVAAAAAAVLLVVRPGALAPSSPAADTRLKGGGLSLEIVARHADGRVAPVFEGTSLRPGDAIRFVVTAPEAGHAAVVGIDGAGQVSIYASATSESPLALVAGRHELPGSVVLDDTAGDERLVALLCATAPTPAALTAAGARAFAASGGDPRRAPPLDLPCRQTGLSIHKDIPR